MYKIVDIRSIYPMLDDVLTLSRVTHSESWNKYKHVLDKALERARLRYEEKAQINDEIIEKDFRYMLGYINALTFVLNIPDEANELIRDKENNYARDN